MTGREEGLIVSWSGSGGRGMIRRADGSQVVFSFSDIRQGRGSYLGLTEGRRVTFLLVNTEAGLRAREVRG